MINNIQITNNQSIVSSLHRSLSSIPKDFCNYLAQPVLGYFSRAKGEEVVHFSGFARKMNHIFLFLRAKRAVAK
jgi:hypothetical protein